MMLNFTYLRLGLFLAALAAAWFVFGWGREVIHTYNDNIAKVERLERNNTLLNTRVDSYKTLLARRDAAIEASKCKVQIKAWIKDPDTIPGRGNPFNPDAGG